MKNSLKKIAAALTFLVCAVLIGGLIYGLFSFVANDLHFSHWGGWGRLLYLILGVFPALICSLSLCLYLFAKEEEE